MKKNTILYYDLDSDTASHFKDRHSKNERLEIEVFTDISSLLSRIDRHIEKPIDLILIDFFSELPLKGESGGEIKAFTSAITEENIDIDDLIMDFQQYKDHVNKEIDKVMLREGVNAADTLLDYFDYKNIDGIQLAIYSMLGRRLITSKDASRLQSKGVMWVWKSKEKLVKKDKESKVSSNAASNAEYHSIHAAIMSGRLRGLRISEVLSDLKVAFRTQILTLFALLLSVVFHIYLAKDSIDGADVFGYLTALIVISISIFGANKIHKKMKALSSRNFT